MRFDIVLLLLVGLPVIMDSLITLQNSYLRYKIEMKKLDEPEEEDPVGFQ